MDQAQQTEGSQTEAKSSVKETLSSTLKFGAGVPDFVKFLIGELLKLLPSIIAWIQASGDDPKVAVRNLMTTVGDHLRQETAGGDEKLSSKKSEEGSEKKQLDE